jgi:hypothetical protein
VKFKIDLHVHSRYSGDTDADPEEMVLHAIEIGLQGIAFTEHYSYEASEPVERLKEKFRDRILVLRGVEFSANEGHCLIFGVNADRADLGYLPAKDMVTVVNRKGGVVIPSHPYRGGSGWGDLVYEVEGLFAVEGVNGFNIPAANTKAVEAARKLGLPFTGGSDAHEPREVGYCYTVFGEAVTEENFIEMLKAGNYSGVDVRRFGEV